MDDKTRTMMLTIAAGIAKKGLMIAGTSLAGHGLINSNQVETFVSIGMVLVGLGWSLWNDYGKAIVLSQLEVLKAKSLAQAAKLQQNSIRPVTTAEIAAQSPTLTPTEVAKTVATLPPVVQATVAKVLIVAVLLSLFVFGGEAFAQDRPAIKLKPLTGNIAKDFEIGDGKIGNTKLTGNAVIDLTAALDARLLPDLTYALKLATAANNTVTAPCFQAWIDIINTRLNAVKNPDGTPIDLPDPHLITDFEKLVEMRNALQPESPFMLKCSPVASMVKLDIAKFMGLVISGGVGLAALVPGL